MIWFKRKFFYTLSAVHWHFTLLKEYASKILLANLPKLSSGTSTGITTSSSAAALSTMKNTFMSRDYNELSSQLQVKKHHALKNWTRIQFHERENIKYIVFFPK